jgi:hypothetical protein
MLFMLFGWERSYFKSPLSKRRILDVMRTLNATSYSNCRDSDSPSESNGFSYTLAQIRLYAFASSSTPVLHCLVCTTDKLAGFPKGVLLVSLFQECEHLIVGLPRVISSNANLS